MEHLGPIRRRSGGPDARGSAAAEPPPPPAREATASERLDDLHFAVEAVVRGFAEAEIAPRAAGWAGAARLPDDVLRRIGEAGLLGVVVPEDLGGAGLDMLALALAVEEIARADAGASVAVAAQNALVAASILAMGTTEQCRRWLPPLAAGELVGAYALNEPQAGPSAPALRTRAEPARLGGWRITGRKGWVASGGVAGLFLVFARTGPGPRGVSAFLADRAPGLQVGPEVLEAGPPGASMAEVVLDGHQVGSDRMLGAPGDGLALAVATLEGSRIVHAAQACGVARAAVDEVVAGAARDVASGAAGAGRRGRLPLNEVLADLEAARLLVHTAARLLDAGQPHGAAAVQAERVAGAVAARAAEVAARAAGASPEHPVAVPRGPRAGAARR